MLLSVENLTSGKTVSYRIQDLTGSIVQVYTTTNVIERYENPLSDGTTTTTTASKLVDSGADFITDGIGVGDFVYNILNNTKTTVSAVDSLTTLSLVSNIFATGEGYSIGDVLGKSIYQVTIVDSTFINADGTEFEGQILWKTTDSPPQTASESVTKLTNQLFPSGLVVTDGSNTSTTFKTGLTQNTTDYWKNTWLRFTTGTLINQIQKVTAYDGTTKFITMTSNFTGAPSGNDAFILINK